MTTPTAQAASSPPPTPFSVPAQDVPPDPPVAFPQRLRCAAGLLLGLRRHDLRAARTFVRIQYAGQPLPVRWARFLGWSLRQAWVTIPSAMPGLTLPRRVARTPFWLDAANPLHNHPWAQDPNAALPTEADTVVIGAGFTGASAAYHWAKRAPVDRRLVVLEMGEAASGASGRNQGTIVMGRYFAMVRDTVRPHLDRVRRDLEPAQRQRLAERFADVYCRAAYRNADLIEETVRTEGFDVDYARNGWVQERRADQQRDLAESAAAGQRFGHTDWTAIDPERVRQVSGMRVDQPAGFSRKAGTWHPAKWVWSLLGSALRAGNVAFYSRTKVLSVDDDADGYLVRTDRGVIRARHVLYGVESYLPKIDRRFHDIIEPHQEQLASGRGAPDAMPSDNSITGRFFFGARRGDVLLVGSDSTRVPDRLAGCSRPSRFLTRFALSEYKRLYGHFRFRLTHEWSGTVGYTPDEYPLIGRLDERGKYIIGGMAGSGSGVAFNAARCIVNRILGRTDEPDDYPEAYFAPSRLLDPQSHPWPTIESSAP